MSGRKGSLPENLLLAALPGADRRRLLAHCATVELVSAEILTEPGQVVRHVIFPIDSFISLIAPIDDEAQLEVGLVGNEGMLGASLVLGVGVSPLRALVQGAGRAWQLDAESVRSNGGLYAVSFRRGASRAVAAHDSRSGAFEPLSNHPGIPRLYAGRAARRRNAGGWCVAAA